MKKSNKNLREIDTDGDGISDFDEINIYKTDPNNKDTDGDGLSDLEELDKGFNPLIRDYFIPNKSNNYRPKALRPQRLFFYGISAIIIKIIVVFTLISVPLSAFFSPDYVAQEAKKIIALTNEIRKNLNLSQLIEDSKLNQAAFYKAEDMAIKQYFSHTNPEGKKMSYWLNKVSYNFRFGGENLAMGFSTAQDAVSAWVNSPSHYKNIIDPDFKDTGVGISNGLYNGVETTFMAQYFGSKTIVQEKIIEEKLETEIILKTEVKEVVPLPVIPAVSPEKSKPTTLVYNSIPTIPEKTKEPIQETNILSEKQDFVIEIPAKLEFQEDKKLFNKDYVQAEIFAPQCTGFSIFVNSEEQINKEGICTSTEQLLTKEGENTILLSVNYPDDKNSKTEYKIILDKSAPEIINTEKTVLLAKENFAKETVVLAEIYLSNDTSEAKLYIKDNVITLIQDENYKSKWTGHMIIDNSDDIFKPVLSATLHASDFAGNELVTDVDWSSIVPLQTSVSDQYNFAKAHKQVSPINTLFNISSIYYKIILTLAIILLLINIFVKIKIQRLDIIVSSLLFIFLIFVLVIF